jgi:hypothetical protein
MIVRVKFSALKEGRWYEYVVRFVLGGLTTVAAGIIANVYGPKMGGLFLAFPAIFCASVTLVEKHERRQKREQGLGGQCRGTDAAALESCGTGLGSIGLGAFALAIWLLAADYGLASLIIASVIWTLVSIMCWRVHQELRHFR